MLEIIATWFAASQMKSACGSALLLWWALAMTWWPPHAHFPRAMTMTGVTLITWALAALLLGLAQLTPQPARATLRMLFACSILVTPIVALMHPVGHTPLRRLVGWRSWRVRALAIGVCAGLALPQSARAQAVPDLIVT